MVASASIAEQGALVIALICTRCCCYGGVVFVVVVVVVVAVVVVVDVVVLRVDAFVIGSYAIAVTLAAFHQLWPLESWLLVSVEFMLVLKLPKVPTLIPARFRDNLSGGIYARRGTIT